MTGLRTFPDEPAPIAVTDKVRDVMLFTVPGLRDEEDDPIVEPDVPMRDDGAEGRFAKAYLHDEIPWMDLRQEVRDLMFLAVPSIDVPDDELDFEDAEVPFDGMEVCWAETQSQDPVEDPVAVVSYEVPELPTAIPAPAAIGMIAASAPMGMLAMPADIPEEAQEAAPAEDVADTPMIAAAQEVMAISAAPAVKMVLEPMEVPAIEEINVIPAVQDETIQVESDGSAIVTEDAPAVRFSFGSQEVQRSGWRVCFSF